MTLSSSDIRVAVVGSFVQDLAFKVESFPATGETRIGSFFTGPGGKGSNQAVACHRLNIPTLFIGAVGNDLFAEGYRSWSRTEQLKTALENIAGAPTGAASIVVNSAAENQIVVALGANALLSPAFVTSALAGAPQLSVVLLQAESNLDAAAAALHFAAEKEHISIFNPAPINPRVGAELLGAASIATPNETECVDLLLRLCGKRCRAEALAAMPDAELKALFADFPAPAVIVTLGAQGALLLQRESPAAQLRGVERGEIRRFPALAVAPVDTTGAGDAFNGGLAAGLVRFNADLPRAIRYATVVAALSTQRQGTAPAMPPAAEVERYSEFFAEK